MIENKPSQQDDKDKQTQPIGMGGAQGGAAGRVAAFSSGQQQTPGSGRFTNLQKYIGANQGAGQQLQQRIGTNVERGVEKTEKQATTQAGQIADQVNKANTALGKVEGFKQQIQQDPTQLAQNQSNAQEVKNLMANQNIGAAVGTQAQQAQDQLQAQANAQAQNIQQLGSEQGRFNLLKNTIKAPNYSTGQQKLDQLFMQAQGGRALDQQQQQLQQNLQALQNRAGAQFSDLASQGKTIGQKEAQASEELRKTISGEETKLSESLDKAAGELNTSRAQLNTDLDAFMSGVATPEQKARIQPILEKSGLKAGMHTYGVLGKNPRESYLQKGDVNLTGASMIDQAGLDRYQALANLAGVTDPNMLKYSQVGNKGQETGLLGEKLKTDVEQAKKQFESNLSNQIINTKTGTTTATANALDLLNYLTGGTGKKTDKGYLTPIDLSGTANFGVAGDAESYRMSGVGNYSSDVYQNGQNGWSFDPGTMRMGDEGTIHYDTMVQGSDQYGQDAIQQLLKQFQDQIRNSDYMEGLGANAGTGFSDPYAKVKLF